MLPERSNRRRGNSYDPEKVTSYVLGSKNRFFSNALQLNAEAFLLKYKNQQLAHLGSIDTIAGPRPGFPTENVGRSTIYGRGGRSAISVF